MCKTYGKYRVAESVSLRSTVAWEREPAIRIVVGGEVHPLVIGVVGCTAPSAHSLVDETSFRQATVVLPGIICFG